MLNDVIAEMTEYLAPLNGESRIDAIEELQAILHELSPLSSQPVNCVRWVPIEKVSPNDYNPNSVASVELQLLYTSIDHDGYTQPVVTIYDEEQDRYFIVDGYHRYFVMRKSPDILERCMGLLPIVVIDKGINDRMASTVRHNRARGKHSITGMANLVFQMLDNGWADEDICNELGMEPEEILRLKHVTGFSKLFADVEYKRSWMTKNQIIAKKRYEESKNGSGSPR